MTLVVHSHLHDRYTGVTRHVEAIVPALRALGVEARVVGRGVSPALPTIRWAELRERARSEKVVLHTHRVHELLRGLALRATGAEVRLVWTRHSVGRPSRFTRWVAARADARVSVSPETADTLGLPSEVIFHGVELDRFAPPPDRDAAFAALPLPGAAGRWGIGVIGRIRPEKGQGDFAEAVGPLLPNHPEWKAMLIGLAKERDAALIARIRQAAPALALVGEQRPIERWYQGLSIVVNPSHQESFGLVRLEAMAAGACLVTTRLNALDRMIEHGRTGLLYDVGDVTSLRELLEPLLREPHRAHEIGRNAAELARSHFGIEHQAKALNALYARILEAGTA